MTIANIKEDLQISFEKQIYQEDLDTIIFLNGSIFNYKQWIPAYIPALKKFAKLANKQLNYIMYDYQGIGLSSPKENLFTLKELALELFLLLDYFKLDRVHLFGVSKGTMVGQVFTGLYPDRVISLAGYGVVNLLSSSIEGTRRMYQNRLNDFESLHDIVHEKITNDNFKRLVRVVFIPALFNKAYSDLSYKQKFITWFLGRKVYQMLESTPIQTIQLLFQTFVYGLEKERDLYSSCIKAIESKPILWMNGLKDKTTPIKLVRDLMPLLSNAKLIEYEKYEHVSPNLNKKQATVLMNEYVSFLNALHQ